jgi:enamine deaminase RidA (YjgF/YER057c/UK114 family)
MSGQLVLVAVAGQVPPAAVWETLPPDVQRQVTLQLARLLARLVEAGRDE